MEEPLIPEAATPYHPKLRSYLFGQCFNVARVSIWWTSLSPLILSVTNQDEAIGATRTAFNVAALVLSPIAGAWVQSQDVSSVLKTSNAVRGFLWTVTLPVAWILGAVVFESTALTFVLLVIICVFDGAAVAFSNVVDIDAGGVDLLGAQHKVTISDKVRNYMNSVHHVVFDTCLLLFTPLLATISLALGEKAFHYGADHQLRSVAMLVVFSGAIGITSAGSHFHYRKLSLEEESGQANNNQMPSVTSLFAKVAEGAKLTLHTPAIRWRLLFLGIETALEDAMTAILITEYAYRSRYFGNGDILHSNFWTAVILAVGRFGAVIAGLFMQKCWTPPQDHLVRGYVPLFLSVLAGGVSTLLLCVGYRLETSPYFDVETTNRSVSQALVFTSVFLFYLFSTGPKIGFETLLQNIAATVEGSGIIFGFVATFVTIIDSVVILAISVVFGMYELSESPSCDEECVSSNFEIGLWFACGLYLAHGIVEGLFGPYLVLPTSAPYIAL